MRSKLTYPLLFICIAITVWAIALVIGPSSASFADPMLEASVRKATGRLHGELLNEHLAQVTTLEIRNSGVQRLDGIERLTGLQHLDLKNNEIENIQALSGLSELRTLNISGNKIADITPLRGLTLLEDVNLRNNKISDILPLKELPLLRGRLYLEGNPIVDYSSIASFYNEVKVRDIDPITPIFSELGGFYEKGVQVALSNLTPGAEIYYTLDGSEPTKQSQKYGSSPITIVNRENEANDIAGIQTAEYGWWKKPGNVFKGTVIRAVSYDAEGNRSKIATRSFFVHPLGWERYSLPIVSLSTDKANLFDEKIGIYVPGLLFQNINPDVPWANPANYNKNGRSWERPVHIEFYETDGTMGFSEDAGMRIHGGFSRANPIKSLRLYFRKEYGKGKLDYPLFPGLSYEKFDTIVLRTSGTDHEGSYLRDAFMQRLLEGTDLDTQAYRPAIVFINGEYWGIHNIRERFDTNYFEEKHGVDPKDLNILESNVSPVSGGSSHYQSMINYIRSNDIRESAVYERVKQMMDVDNFIDYQASEIYFDDTDWPGNNIKYWREIKDYDPASAYGRDGKWRWLVYDTDFGFGMFGEQSYKNDSLEMAATPNGESWPNPEWATFLLRTLLLNDEFRTRFINRYADLMNTSFEPERVVATLHEMRDVIAPEMQEHINRWGRPYRLGHWQWQIDVIEKFAKERPNYARQHIVRKFQLPGTAKLGIDKSVEEGGTVKVNTIIASGPVWEGMYFKNVPIKLTAVPRTGYRFAGWEGDVKSNAPTIEITMEGDMKVVPKFVKK